nr:Smr/MutS family protein [Gemmatimonadales bacterium]
MADWTDREPDAELDLHGQTVIEAVANAERFIRAQKKAR